MPEAVPNFPPSNVAHEDRMAIMREAKTAELFGRSPERWLDIESVLRDALSKGFGRKAWRDRAWKVLHG